MMPDHEPSSDSDDEYIPWDADRGLPLTNEDDDGDE